ncbi:MBL fold metallo-hydrolase [Mesonia aquimarina]|uniref:MBL fold metallo-hydrolase n=1 Tax=Mesonia aquimarina TaxID=1504967 RepID=UPI000EF5F047|nr:MBL fold metallo-hydrolase [Mesonia aquimarina]
MKKIILFSVIIFGLIACKEQNKSQKDTQQISPAVKSKTEEEQISKDSIEVTPISHATFTMKLNNKLIVIDPVGGKKAFNSLEKPDIILITDIHGDHLNVETVKNIVTNKTSLLVPKAVSEKVPESLSKNVIVLNNGEEKLLSGITIKAIPMYNLREEAKDFHVKGRGNGYILEANNKRVYISGDTEDIPEMRNLEDIDLAFVCMNLPYTMPVDAAADAVLDFKPKKVYPYHFRGKNGFSDVEKFKNIINTNNPKIKVEILDWYPAKK